MTTASLQTVAKKSAVKILTEIAAGFTEKDDYLRHLEYLAIIAFKDALCTVDEYNLGMSVANRADSSFGRSAAFLLHQELEIQRRLNVAVCGREIELDGHRD